MDNKKIGEFIRELRKEKNYTQEELAQLIPIGREAVSKWERGKNKPDKSSLVILSKIFGVSIDELMIGRKIRNCEVDSKSADIKLNLYEENNKNIQFMKLSKRLITLIIILFLGYYFISTYNTIKVYTINYSDDKITIKDGIFTTTREKIYFNLGDIISNEEIKSIKLYYKINNDIKIIYKTDDIKVILYDYYGYNNYFNYSELKEILNESYIDVEFDNTIHTIKIEYKKDFSNSKLFNKKSINIVETKKDNVSNKKIDINKLKKDFKYKDGLYIYEKKNQTITYFEDISMLQLIIKGESNEEWNFYINENVLDYSEYNDKNEIINSFINSGDEISCKINNCKKDKEKIKVFFDKLNDII